MKEPYLIRVLGLTLQRKGCSAGAYFLPEITEKKVVRGACAPRRKLLIELDGSQHREHEGYDRERTAFLESKGYRALRFWNNQVMNEMQAALQIIENVLAQG